MTRETPLLRTDFLLLREMQSRWADNDMYGHMNNTVHYQLFDTILNSWLIENGLLDPIKSDVIGMIVNTSCSYFAELGFPEPVLAGLRVARIGRTSITYSIALFSNGQNAAAQGLFTHVLVNRHTRKPCDIPEAWKAALATLQPPQRAA